MFFLVKNLVANEDEMYVSDGEVEQQDNDARYLGTSHDIRIYCSIISILVGYPYIIFGFSGKDIRSQWPLSG